MKKIIYFFTVIIAFILCSNTADAKKQKKLTRQCPAGMFCTANGMYTYESEYSDVSPYMLSPAQLVPTTSGWVWSDEGLCSTNKNSDPTCIYTATDYDEVWVSTPFGFYMIKNGDVMYKSSLSTDFPGMFPCPGTYPSSDSGVQSVFQCYRIVSNGEKEYYTAPNNTKPKYNGSYNTDDINVILTSLQSALAQAETAAQNLQGVLQKSNKLINVAKPPVSISAANINGKTITSNINNEVETNNINNETTTDNLKSTFLKPTDKKLETTTKTPKLDFGNLSSIFSVDKAAVHTPNPGRIAVPTKNIRTINQRTTIRNTSNRQPTNSRTNIKKKRSPNNVT